MRASIDVHCEDTPKVRIRYFPTSIESDEFFTLGIMPVDRTTPTITLYIKSLAQLEDFGQNILNECSRFYEK